MKKSIRFATGLLAFAILTAGCHRHPNNLTPIPGMEEPSNPGVNPGETVPPTQPVNPVDTTHGIGFNANDLANLIANDPNHKENRDMFQNDTVYFDFDKSTIKPSEEGKLQDIYNHFRSTTDDALQVEGNCDERGTEKYNLALGERRALAIREYLVHLGMEAGRIKTVTDGASKPVDPGHNEAAWKKNRRGDSVQLTR